MKSTLKLKWIVALFFVAVNVNAVLAQNKADVFDEKVPVTWLGLDFSQTTFVGPHSNDLGIITNEMFRDNYTTAWNQLFLDEPKKFDIAKATHHPTVKNAIDVTGKANKALNHDFFAETSAANASTGITEAKIIELVKKYDFQNNEGLGLMFIVERMSKPAEIVGLWITYVDMKTKTVLFTTYHFEKVGGFGFRNYYAKPFYTTLKFMDSNFNDWKKANK
jgi:hypothetical protein